MNIFILNTGRCGSMTFVKACQHITNYSALHESRADLIGEQRLAYPDQHIEADNRLSWILGRLHTQYGNDAFYVHLHRDPTQTAASFSRRDHFGIMKAYREGILLGAEKQHTTQAIAEDYIATIESNIQLFLQDKHNTMDFRLENAKNDFKQFWNAIGAEGDLASALREWDTCYNAST